MAYRIFSVFGGIIAVCALLSCGQMGPLELPNDPRESTDTPAN